MKHSRFLCVLLGALMLCSATALFVSAKAGADVFIYTYTDLDPMVDTQTVFVTAFDTEKDIEIRGERASWYFYYDNIHLSTNTWAPFSAAVTVKNTDNTHIINALSDTPAYHVDLADGDSYPGPAEVTIPVSDITGSGTFHLYSYKEHEDGTPALVALAKNFTLDENGAFTVTATCAFDFLLIPANVSPEVLEEFFTVSVVEEASLFSGASLPWIILFAAIGLVLILLCIYAVTVKVLKAKRKKQK